MTMTDTVVTTAEVVANQLAENTGTHFLDSGMARGRAWQRNQDRAEATGQSVLEMFQAQSPAWWDGWGVTLSTFHWMTEHLEHHAAMQRRLDRWINLGWIGLARYDRGPETNHPGTIDDWIDRMIAHGWAEEHPEFDGWTNTYNHDNLLSQDLQFRCFETTDDHPLGEMSLVAMSTHNGADARGGYSDFKIYECDPWEMWDWDVFTAHCEQCESHPDPADTTLFDNAPYVPESYGYWDHRGGSFESDAPGYDYGMKLIFEPRWDAPDWEVPDDFEQEGPICPIHHINMEVWS